VLTVFLALGAWRISRNNVLTRRMPAVETLGAATVLCVDKTGTLTQNQMTLRKLAGPGRTLDLATLRGALPEELHNVLENAILASKRDPFDPMERALHVAGDGLIKDTEHLHPGWSLAREYPLTPGLLAVSHAWSTGNGDDVVVAAKGAPEAIADLCHMTPAQIESLSRDVATLASQGLRVLGVARGVTRQGSLPDEHHDLSLELVHAQFLCRDARHELRLARTQRLDGVADLLLGDASHGEDLPAQELELGVELLRGVGR